MVSKIVWFLFSSAGPILLAYWYAVTNNPPIPTLWAWLGKGGVMPFPLTYLALLTVPIGLGLLLYSIIQDRRLNRTGKFPLRPPPLEVAFEIKSLRCLTLNDQILGGGPAGAVEVVTDILFTPKHPPIKLLQVVLEVHSKRIPAITLMGDITEQISEPYFFIVPKALAKNTVGRIIVTTDQGPACSESQMVSFSQSESK